MLAVIVASTLVSCGEREYEWAFAQNMDGSFHENELCRETLAETIYASRTRDQIEATSLPNVFIYRGSVETYRIYAFHGVCPASSGKADDAAGDAAYAATECVRESLAWSACLSKGR